MTKDLPEMDFQRFWRRLQQLGLNAYEARSYLVLIGHPRFKALELAARAHVPRQKIYEVLDSLAEKGFAQVVQEKTKLFSAVEPTLAEKGFAQVVQEKTKLFSAVEPTLAVPSYLARRAQILQQVLTEQSRLAGSLVDDLAASYSEGQGGRGTLDFLRIVSEPSQTAIHYRKMLGDVQEEYFEFSRPPYAVDPLDEKLVKQARARGVTCRLLIEAGTLDSAHRHQLEDYAAAGVEVRQAESLPMKLALFDSRAGMVALLDPITTKPAWTSVVFDHFGMGEAMKGLFDNYWRKAGSLVSESGA